MKKNLIVLSVALFLHLFVKGQAPEGYYNGTSELEGKALKVKLREIVGNQKRYTYSEVKSALQIIYEDSENTENILLFYKGNSIPKTDFATNNEPDYWNREHTWPKSHGFPDESDSAYTDLQHLTPSDASVNASKSNKDFNNVEHTSVNEEGDAPNTYTDEDYFEPRDEVKGDVARILFYMDTRYTGGDLNLELVDRQSGSSDPELGIYYTLIKWHELDPVSNAELKRQDLIYDYQGNRNPYIDHPEWVASIYGATDVPVLTYDTINFNTDFGLVSEALDQAYEIHAYNLTDHLKIGTTAPYSLSLDREKWGDTLDISVSDEERMIVYVKFTPKDQEGIQHGLITHQTKGINDFSISLNGKKGSLNLMTIQEAREMPAGSTVYVAGVVIGGQNNSSTSRVLYDGTAGIVLYSFDEGNLSADLVIGDSVTVRGNLVDYNNLLEIAESPIEISLIKKDARLPDPQVLTISEIGENEESELVTLEGVTFIQKGTFQGGGADGNYVIQDQTGAIIFRLGNSGHPLAGTEIPLGEVNVTGFIGQYYDDYQISPREVSDIQDSEGQSGVLSTVSGIEFSVFPNPADETLYFSGLDAGKFKIEIFDLKGNKVLNEKIESNGSVDVKSLKHGVYLLRLHGEKRIITTHIIKK